MTTTPRANTASIDVGARGRMCHRTSWASISGGMYVDPVVFVIIGLRVAIYDDPFCKDTAS
jgi:hypothetical protein